MFMTITTIFMVVVISDYIGVISDYIEDNCSHMVLGIAI